MMKFAPIVDQLKGAGFKYVEGILEMAMLGVKGPRQSPALFIVPERDTARPNTFGAGAVDQKVTDTFSVVLAVLAESTANMSSEVLVQHAKQIENALVGWKHPDAKSPCEYVGGNLVSLDGLRITWKITFSLSRHIRKTS